MNILLRLTWRHAVLIIRRGKWMVMCEYHASSSYASEGLELDDFGALFQRVNRTIRVRTTSKPYWERCVELTRKEKYVICSIWVEDLHSLRNFVLFKRALWLAARFCDQQNPTGRRLILSRRRCEMGAFEHFSAIVSGVRYRCSPQDNRRPYLSTKFTFPVSLLFYTNNYDRFTDIQQTN